jgi:hypothetical protein
MRRAVLLTMVVLAFSASVAVAGARSGSGIVGHARYRLYTDGPLGPAVNFSRNPTVNLRVEATQAGHRVAVARTKWGGWFALNVKPGVYELRVETPGHSRCGHLKNVLVRRNALTHIEIYCNVQ